jgi:hypothetical protein
MNIKEFKEALGEGGARPNQFRVEILFPGDTATANEQLLVTGASLPASTVNPAIIQYRGREIKLAGERIFDPWTITIVNDTKFNLRKKFESWMNAMNDRTDNTADLLEPGEYQRDIKVFHLDRNDSTLMEIQLEEAFPINMSEIALQYAQNDIIEEYTVTFQYQSYNVTPE